MNIIQTLALIAAVSSVTGTALADTTDAADTIKSAANYVYPVNGGVNYNQKELRWKEVHSNDVRTELLGQNG